MLAGFDDGDSPGRSPAGVDRTVEPSGRLRATVRGIPDR
jgi:hypothetical protein